MYAPIALFVFNRADHTSRTIEALKLNALAAESDLFVFSDGARRESDLEGVQEVRKLIHAISGFRSVKIIEQPSNLGLAASIIAGVSLLCEQFGKVIVLEDDLITTPSFLTFMNDGLVAYEEENKVMHISGYTYPIDVSGYESDSFFLRLPMCWGWATWHRAWSKFSADVSLGATLADWQRKRINFDGTHDYWVQYELNRTGEIRTWFIFWYISVFCAGGLALFPARSLVRNIGLDASGTHKTSSNSFDVVLSNTAANVEKISIQEVDLIVERHKRYFLKIAPSRIRILARNFKNALKVHFDVKK